MKTILVPMDFSPNADSALAYATKVAKRAGAKIIIMHACHLLEEKFTGYQSLIKEENESVQKEIFTKINKLAEAVERNAKIRATVGVYNGADVTESILQAAEDSSADIIIMGTYGTTGIKRKLFGSKAADIINKSRIPVLTVPPGYKWIQPKRIVLAIDNLPENVSFIKPVFQLATLFQGSVSVVVFTEEEALAAELVSDIQIAKTTQRKLKLAFKDSNIDVNHLVGTHFEESIREFISDMEIDVLAMVTYKRNFIENIVDSSITQKMSYYSKVPLLSLHKAF
jgi:nucleotide-binding universal stress UspA family protein